jgi:hypothetical protein
LLRGLVLNDIPVFDENSILQANDVRCDPVRRQTDIGEPAMNDDVVTFCKNYPGLILERLRSGLDEVEEPISSRLDMSAVLNVIGRPEPLRRRVAAFVEQVSNASSTIALFFSAFELLIGFLSCKSTFDVFV